MHITGHIRRAPRHLARLLGPLGMGCALLAAALGSGAAHAAPAARPRTACTTVQCVIQFGDTAIQARITALGTLGGKITDALNDKRISQSDAAALQGDVGTNQSGLTQLKAKLDAETDIAAARQDVKAIYTQFRIFAVVLPRDYNEIWLDAANEVVGDLQGAAGKVQDALTKAASLTDTDHDGDLATANAAFSDEQGQVTAAQGQISTAQGLIASLTPQSFDGDPPGYRGTFATFHGAIRTAHTDLVAAAADLHKIDRVLIELLAEQPNSGRAAQPEP
jgi:hypothetical protein